MGGIPGPADAQTRTGSLTALSGSRGFGRSEIRRRLRKSDNVVGFDAPGIDRGRAKYAGVAMRQNAGACGTENREIVVGGGEKQMERLFVAKRSRFGEIHT